MVSAIIIGHSNRPFLKRCLDSLISQTISIDEIVYIDNNSIDNSVDYVELNFPQISIMKNKSNYGYAKAANQGIDRARNEFVLILNPDMILDPDYLYHSISAIKDVAKAAGVIGKIYKYDFYLNAKTDVIDTIGLVAMKDRRFLDNGAAISDKDKFSKPMEIFGISGNCALFRKAALQDGKIDTEYFDEDFFMYKEDVDLCWRLRLLGWTFLFTPYAIAFHRRGTGVLQRNSLIDAIKARRQLSSMQRYYSYKNHRLMIIKNELLITFIEDFIYIVPREVAAALFTLLFESTGIKSFIRCLMQIPIAIRKRRIIMKKRRSKARDIRPWLHSSGLIQGGS